jgi:hypothetical protein
VIHNERADDALAADIAKRFAGESVVCRHPRQKRRRSIAAPLHATISIATLYKIGTAGFEPATP